MDDEIAEGDGGAFEVGSVWWKHEPGDGGFFGVAEAVYLAKGREFGFQAFEAFPGGGYPDAVHFGFVLPVAEEQQELLPGIDRGHAEEGLDGRFESQQVVQNEIEWYFAFLVHIFDIMEKHAVAGLAITRVILYVKDVTR